MSLRLPPPNHPARSLFDIVQLAELADSANVAKLPMLRQAKAKAAEMFAADRAIRRVHMLVLRAEATIELVAFGPRGGHKTLWQFGRR